MSQYPQSSIISLSVPFFIITGGNRASLFTTAPTPSSCCGLCLLLLFLSHDLRVSAISWSCNQQSQSQQSNLAILCSFVIPALAACSLAALDFPLSFLAAFSLARSLWLPLVILDNVAVLRSEENTKSEIKAKYFRFGLLGRWVKEEISLMCWQNCRLFLSLLPENGLVTNPLTKI